MNWPHVDASDGAVPDRDMPTLTDIRDIEEINATGRNESRVSYS